MAKPNFKFQKRQRELEKKTKQDEKLLRKQERAGTSLEEDVSDAPAPAEEGDSGA